MNDWWYELVKTCSHLLLRILHPFLSAHPSGEGFAVHPTTYPSWLLFRNGHRTKGSRRRYGPPFVASFSNYISLHANGFRHIFCGVFCVFFFSFILSFVTRLDIHHSDMIGDLANFQDECLHARPPPQPPSCPRPPPPGRYYSLGVCGGWEGWK